MVSFIINCSIQSADKAGMLSVAEYLKDNYSSNIEHVDGSGETFTTNFSLSFATYDEMVTAISTLDTQHASLTWSYNLSR